ncbi:hypothetical protein C8R43DRAFT_1138010 [Mycena crocata]|nr:hypothetical protein C8R43DRAFT_1138010 [Mycena crocata]
MFIFYLADSASDTPNILQDHSGLDPAHSRIELDHDDPQYNNNAPVQAQIDRPSVTGRRVYTQTVAVEASPLKRKKKTHEHVDGDMIPDMNDWRPMRGAVLNIMLARDGRMDACEKCPGCDLGRKANFHCRHCFGDEMYCKQCLACLHTTNPLHIVECWHSACFEKTTLKVLELRIQFGHRGCVKPHPSAEGFVILHLNGIHEVNVDFCGCDKEKLHGTPYEQLLKGSWYPATTEKPHSAATFELLDFFHAQTLQAKMTMYDFYVVLEKITNNTGIKPANRYTEFLRMARQYRHLLMLKRSGRAHDPSGVYGTQPGECAVLCPACPRPGVNLPDDWHQAPPEMRYLYILFLALDACFRLKRRMVSSNLRDPGLGTGWAHVDLHAWNFAILLCFIGVHALSEKLS